MGEWLNREVKSGLFDRNQLIVDVHNYYNWDGPLSWQQLAAKVCNTQAANSEWAQYIDAGLSVLIGEWSVSSNLGARAYTNISDPSVVAKLKMYVVLSCVVYGCSASRCLSNVWQNNV